MRTVARLTPPRDLRTLSLACLAHLEQEEAMLAATLDSLRRVRVALLGGDLKALNAALDEQAHTARAAAELQIRRNTLREQWAEALHVPVASLTLQRLAQVLSPELAPRIVRQREKLHAMAAEIERLNRANAAVVQHSLSFLHQLFSEITGGEQNGPSYDAGGRRQESACGFFLEAQG